MLEPTYYEQSEPKPIGKCPHCGEPVMEYEEHYKFDDDVVHDDCVISYIQQFKVYGGIE